MHSVAWALGLTDSNSTPYLWWSGIFADLGVLGGLVMVWRHLVCHTPGCHRLAVKHPMHRACKRHLP